MRICKNPLEKKNNITIQNFFKIKRNFVLNDIKIMHLDSLKF